METARESLTLFMRSLPERCMFTIISFGHEFQSDNFENIVYDNNTKNSAIEKIALFEADHGGTEIRQPLAKAQSDYYDASKKKRIFVLTDG